MPFAATAHEFGAARPVGADAPAGGRAPGPQGQAPGSHGAGRSRPSGGGHRRGLSRRAALAIWAACLAGGVGLGMLTDGRSGPGPGGGDEPAEQASGAGVAGPVDDPPAYRAPAATAGRAAGPVPAGSVSGPAHTPSSTPPTAPSSPADLGPLADVGDLDGADAQAIVEAVLSGLVPAFDPAPETSGAPATTAAPPPATDAPPTSASTTAPPPSTTTPTTSGPGPSITGIPFPPG